MTSRNFKHSQSQSGFSFVEMLVATVIVLASLGPAINALQSARLAVDSHALETQLHYQVLGRSEDVLAEPTAALLNAANLAGGIKIASAYSDPAGSIDRVAVYISFYDIVNTDGDNDPFTIADKNIDGDKNPYTGPDSTIEMLWLRVGIPGTTHFIETLSKR